MQSENGSDLIIQGMVTILGLTIDVGILWLLGILTLLHSDPSKDGEPPKDGEPSKDGDHPKDVDRPGEGYQLRVEDPSMNICENLEYCQTPVPSPDFCLGTRS